MTTLTNTQIETINTLVSFSSESAQDSIREYCYNYLGDFNAVSGISSKQFFEVRAELVLGQNCISVQDIENLAGVLD